MREADEGEQDRVPVSVNIYTPPTRMVDPGEEFTVEVRGAFDDVEDITAVPTPFTPASDGHPLAPITGPIVVRGAKLGDVVAIDLIELTPFGFGKIASYEILGCCATSPGADGVIVRSARRPRLVLRPHSVAAQPQSRHDLNDATRRYKPSYAGAYGGDFDEKDAGQGSRVYLPVLVDDALVFFGDPHAPISDGIITGTGIGCSMNVRARIDLLKDRTLERPIIAQGGAVHFVGVGPSVEEVTQDAARHAVDFTFARAGLGREERLS